jgi:adenylate kinase
MTATRHALLLLGPTAAGKTPLGEEIQQRGLWGSRWAHFDFGANLRAIATGQGNDGRFRAAEVQFIRNVLQRGALLEDQQFPLARRILEAFLEPFAAEPQTRVVLNGLPRHVGQADALAAIVHVQTVVALRCSETTVLERIGRNAGGDRAGRTDDDRAAVQQKLALFAARTAPLLEHYGHQGARIVSLDVSASMTAAEMLEILNAEP